MGQPLMDMNYIHKLYTRVVAFVHIENNITMPPISPHSDAFIIFLSNIFYAMRRIIVVVGHLYFSYFSTSLFRFSIVHMIYFVGGRSLSSVNAMNLLFVWATSKYIQFVGLRGGGGNDIYNFFFWCMKSIRGHQYRIYCVRHNKTCHGKRRSIQRQPNRYTLHTLETPETYSESGWDWQGWLCVFVAI